MPLSFVKLMRSAVKANYSNNGNLEVLLHQGAQVVQINLNKVLYQKFACAPSKSVVWKFSPSSIMKIQDSSTTAFNCLLLF